MTRPTIHLTSWSSRSYHSGRVLSIMARPRHWEHGDGLVDAFVPPLEMLYDVIAGALSAEDYLSGLLFRWRGRGMALLPYSPGGLYSTSPGGGLPLLLVRDGDTLCCSCAQHAPCHRRAAAIVLLEAGWDVVLDGDRIAMGPDPKPSAHDVFWSGTYIGTNADPREAGWCETCGRGVYDGDPSGHRGER